MASTKVTVPDEVWRDFKRLAFELHGTLHGALKPEMERAIRSHVEVMGREVAAKKQR